MPTEAEGSLIKISAWITQETDLDLLRYAREKGIMDEIRVLNLETNEPRILPVANKSGAIRAALEEFFAGRKGK